MKQIYGLVFIFFLCVAAHAQTIKTDAGRRISAIEFEITKLQSLIVKTSEILAQRGEEYSPDAPEMVELKKLLAQQQRILLKLESEKKALATKELTKRLPNTDLDLLKVIAVQNDRIIDLLELLVRRSQ